MKNFVYGKDYFYENGVIMISKDIVEKSNTFVKNFLFGEHYEANLVDYFLFNYSVIGLSNSLYKSMNPLSVLIFRLINNGIVSVEEIIEENYKMVKESFNEIIKSENYKSLLIEMIQVTNPDLLQVYFDSKRVENDKIGWN